MGVAATPIRWPPSRGELRREVRRRLDSRCPILTQSHARASLRSALREAEVIGFCEGLRDRQASRYCFSTGPEWIAWLRGWRAGQMEFKAQEARASERGRQQGS